MRTNARMRYGSLRYVAAFNAVAMIEDLCDMGDDKYGREPMSCLKCGYFSRKSETEFNRMDIPTHTHRALLMVGMISIKPPQSSFSTRIAPSE